MRVAAPSGGLFGSLTAAATSATPAATAPAAGGLFGGSAFDKKPETPALSTSTTTPSLFGSKEQPAASSAAATPTRE